MSWHDKPCFDWDDHGIRWHEERIRRQRWAVSLAWIGGCFFGSVGGGLIAIWWLS